MISPPNSYMGRCLAVVFNYLLVAVFLKTLETSNLRVMGFLFLSIIANIRRLLTLAEVAENDPNMNPVITESLSYGFSLKCLTISAVMQVSLRFSIKLQSDNNLPVSFLLSMSTSIISSA